VTQQVINIGAAPNDGTGDQLRVSFDKCNQNFSELYDKGAGASTEGVWNFNAASSDTSTAPVSGRFKTNSGNYRGATQIAIHATTVQGIDRSDTLRSLLAKDIIQVQDTGNSAAWCRYVLQSVPVNNGTWFQLNVAWEADGGVVSGDNQEILFTFTANLDLSDVYMRWVPYTGPPQSFLKQDVTRDGDWTMVANRDTSDRPAPQASGAEEDLLPTWTPTTQSARATYTVYNEWTVNTGGWIDQYGGDVLTQNLNATHTITLQINGVVKDTFTSAPVTAQLYWHDITPVLVPSGAVIRVTVKVTQVSNNLMYWLEQAGLFATAPTYCSLAVGSKDGAAAGTTAYGCHVMFIPGTASPDWDVLAYGGAVAGGGGGGGSPPGGASGQIQYNNGGAFGGFTMSGDATLNTTTGAITIPVFVASGASHAKGNVPDPGSTAGTTRFLREDASWQTPPTAPALPGYIGGLTLANDTTTPNTVIDVAAGGATSDDYTTTMILSAAFTKNCNAAWAVGSGNGALDTGSTIPAAAWLHVFLIMRTDTGVVDVLISQSATAPTMPTNYTKKRRIGSVKTASSAILGFTQLGDEFLLLASILDLSGITATTTPTSYPITVPSGISVDAIMDFIVNAAIGPTISVRSPLQTGGSFQVFGPIGTGGWAGTQVRVRTDTSGNVQVYANASCSGINATTIGWLDNRGK
jgi:hypothetical protein